MLESMDILTHSERKPLSVWQPTPLQLVLLASDDDLVMKDVEPALPDLKTVILLKKQ
jgi:hypothetical protein